jgi:hypothetical protein
VARDSDNAAKTLGPKIATLMASSASANSAAVILEYGKPFGEQDINDLVEVLSGHFELVRNGNLTNVEDMLYGQALALQTIFTKMARRVGAQGYLKHEQTYLALALKAQNQCRATLETLVMMKNPASVAFVRQANIGQAVQVNNGSSTQKDASRARENQNQQNELSRESNELPTYSSAPAPTGRIDSELAAVGEVNRAKDSCR